MKQWKLRKFFGDVVYDLRNRGLLPVVAFLLIAMVAVPVIISRGGSDTASSAQLAGATAEQAPETKQAVVSYNPGVRDYQKRLDGQSAQDPFHQRFSEDAAAAGQVSGTSVVSPSPSGTSGSAGSASVSPGTDSGSVAGPGSTDGSNRSGGGSRSVRYFYSVADVSMGDVMQPLQRHKKLKPFTPLPNQTTPVLIYLGSSLEGKHAYFSVSKSVDQLSGAGTCVPSPTDCTLLVLAAGQTEDMVYSVDGRTFRVKVNKINRVVTKSKPVGSSNHAAGFHFTK
jgi:hypothetical protein